MTPVKILGCNYLYVVAREYPNFRCKIYTSVKSNWNSGSESTLDSSLHRIVYDRSLVSASLLPKL